MDNTRRNYISGRLSDKDILLDILHTEKQLSHLYEHAVTEASNLEIHTIMEEFQRDGHENSYTIFNAMQQRGWYNPSTSQSQQNFQQQNWREPSWQDYSRDQSQRTRLGRKKNYSLSSENKLSGQSQFYSS
jgi:spore coat protein CotF